MNPVPEYNVYMNKPAHLRFNEIIEYHKDDGVNIMTEALEQAGLDRKLGVIANTALSRLYNLSGGYYTDEFDAWAEGLNVKRQDLLTANITYELGQLGTYTSKIAVYGETVKNRILGCTAAARYTDRGWMHIRNLDWPLESMRNTTIIVNYIHDDRVVVAATYPGLVGVLSGMVKDKFSITLNWVDPVRLPGFEFGPLFLVRWVLEHAADFQEAVEYLAGTTLSCSALFMVTGPEKNEACVIERTDKEAAVRFASGKSIAVANHYICDEFIHLNSSEVDPEDELEDFSEGTEERYNYALGTAKKFKGKTLQSAMKILSDDPVNNFDTVQRIAFNVSTGEFIIR